MLKIGIYSLFFANLGLLKAKMKHFYTVRLKFADKNRYNNEFKGDVYLKAIRNRQEICTYDQIYRKSSIF